MTPEILKALKETRRSAACLRNNLKYAPCPIQSDEIRPRLEIAERILDGLDAVIKEAEGEGAREFEVRVVPNHKKSKLACDIYAGEEYISGAYEREAELFGFDLDKPATYRLTVTRLPDPKPKMEEGVRPIVADFLKRGSND